MLAMTSAKSGCNGTNDLQATLGPNITWNEITPEMTNEPITNGLATKLPWLRESFEKNLMLDGAPRTACAKRRRRG
jgi:hypothetical protein